MPASNSLRLHKLPDLAGKRILIVEDEYFLAFDLADILQRLGVDVVGPAPSVAHALEILDRSGRIDGAVLDVNLAGEVVFPLAEVLQRRRIPFAFTTAYEPQLIPGAFQSAPFYRKPIDVEEVALTLLG